MVSNHPKNLKKKKIKSSSYSVSRDTNLISLELLRAFIMRDSFTSLYFLIRFPYELQLQDITRVPQIQTCVCIQ